MATEAWPSLVAPPASYCAVVSSVADCSFSTVFRLPAYKCRCSPSDHQLAVVSASAYDVPPVLEKCCGRERDLPLLQARCSVSCQSMECKAQHWWSNRLVKSPRRTNNVSVLQTSQCVRNGEWRERPSE